MPIPPCRRRYIRNQRWLSSTFTALKMPERTHFESPFQSSPATAAGRGEVVLEVLPPNNPSVTKQAYKYPLKLLSRTPACQLNSKFPACATTPVHLYLLSFGGGLLPGDALDVSITLKPRVRLVLTTPQGSTKIFRTDEEHSHISGKSNQIVKVELGRQTGLCYLPEPSVPFQDSKYEQVQQFTFLKNDEPANSQCGPGEVDDPSCQPPSLCVLDWVTSGRVARGENWSFHHWTGRNEVWMKDCKTGERKLLVRDTVLLDDQKVLSTDDEQPENTTLNERKDMSASPLPIAARTNPHGVLGTLILHGPLFDDLADFFMKEFTSQPRIGGKDWSSSEPEETLKSKRTSNGVMWTAARVRQNFVLVKFGADELETAKEWLSEMIRREGSVEREFGDEALGSL